jgi:hypothetical protein
MNVLIEMTALFASHPSNTAPVEEVATWYREKGRFHERLAEHCRPEERADEVRYAAAAREHARLLLSRARVVSVADQPAGDPIALAHRNRVPRAA